MKTILFTQRISSHLYLARMNLTSIMIPLVSGVAKGGQGGHGPRAQALEGAPAQLIGANFKKKIRPRQIIKVTSLQCRINLAAKLPFFLLKTFFFFFFFLHVDFFPRGGCRIYQTEGRGGGAPRAPKAPAV